MGILSGLLQLYLLVLFAYVVLSFVPRPPEPLQPLVRGIRALVEPVLNPLRQRLRPVRLGGIALDLSIIILFVVVQILIFLLGSVGL